MNTIYGKHVVFSRDDLGLITCARIDCLAGVDDKRKRKSILKDIARLLPKQDGPDTDAKTELVAISSGADVNGNLVVIASYESSTLMERLGAYGAAKKLQEHTDESR